MEGRVWILVSEAGQSDDYDSDATDDALENISGLLSAESFKNTV